MSAVSLACVIFTVCFGQVGRLPGIPFIGAINENMKIEMKLSFSDSKITGKYFYAKKQKPGVWPPKLKLVGTLDPSRNITLRETDEKGTYTGQFQGKFTSDVKIEGQWSTPDGSTTYPFSLKAQFNPWEELYPGVTRMFASGLTGERILHEPAVMRAFYDPHAQRTEKVTFEGQDILVTLYPVRNFDEADNLGIPPCIYTIESKGHYALVEGEYSFHSSKYDEVYISETDPPGLVISTASGGSSPWGFLGYVLSLEKDYFLRYAGKSSGGDFRNPFVDSVSLTEQVLMDPDIVDAECPYKLEKGVLVLDKPRIVQQLEDVTDQFEEDICKLQDKRANLSGEIRLAICKAYFRTLLGERKDGWSSFHKDLMRLSYDGKNARRTGIRDTVEDISIEYIEDAVASKLDEIEKMESRPKDLMPTR